MFVLYKPVIHFCPRVSSDCLVFLVQAESSTCIWTFEVSEARRMPYSSAANPSWHVFLCFMLFLSVFFARLLGWPGDCGRGGQGAARHQGVRRGEAELQPFHRGNRRPGREDRGFIYSAKARGLPAVADRNKRSRREEDRGIQVVAEHQRPRRKGGVRTHLQRLHSRVARYI